MCKDAAKDQALHRVRTYFGIVPTKFRKVKDYMRQYINRFAIEQRKGCAVIDNAVPSRL